MWGGVSEPSSDFDFSPFDLEGVPDVDENAQDEAIFVHEMSNKRYRVSSMNVLFFY
jgi:hypothetical protein